MTYLQFHLNSKGSKILCKFRHRVFLYTLYTKLNLRYSWFSLKHFLYKSDVFSRLAPGTFKARWNFEKLYPRIIIVYNFLINT